MEVESVKQSVVAVRRLWLLALVTVMTTMAWVASSLAQSDGQVPGNADLPRSVHLVLTDADVTVTLVPDAPFAVQALRTQVSQQGAREQVAVELARSVEHMESQERAGGLDVLRLDRPEGLPGRLIVTLVLDPGETLQVEGSHLAVSVRDMRGPSNTPATQRPADPLSASNLPQQFGLELSLEDSSATVAGVRNLIVNSTRSDLQIENTSDYLVLGLNGGSLRLADHRGNLVLRGEDASLRVEDFSGWHTVDLTRSELTARRWLGRGSTKVDSAVFDLEEFKGDLQVMGRDGAIAVRRMVGKSVDVQGDELRVRLEEVEAPLAAELRGGSLVVANQRGDIRWTTTGATCELRDSSGTAILVMHGGSETTVQDHAGLVRAQATDSKVELDGVESLAILADNAQVTARRIGQLNKTTVANSQIDLDLAGATKVSSMALSGATRADIVLSAPCVVRTLGIQGGLPGEAAEVTGCDLETPDQPRRLHANRRYGGQAVILNVTLDAEVELTVTGQ